MTSHHHCVSGGLMPSGPAWGSWRRVSWEAVLACKRVEGLRGMTRGSLEEIQQMTTVEYCPL